MKIHHIAIRAGSVPELARFYLDVLGLPRLDAPRDGVEWFDLDSTILMIEPRDVASQAEPGRLAVLALQIDIEERQTWKAKLTSAGVIIHTESPFSLYFRDPEGNALALSHYPDLRLPY